jgi:hypothetical protein
MNWTANGVAPWGQVETNEKGESPVVIYRRVDGGYYYDAAFSPELKGKLAQSNKATISVEYSVARTTYVQSTVWFSMMKTEMCALEKGMVGISKWMLLVPLIADVNPTRRKWAKKWRQLRFVKPDISNSGLRARPPDVD